MFLRIFKSDTGETWCTILLWNKEKKNGMIQYMSYWFRVQQIYTKSVTNECIEYQAGSEQQVMERRSETTIWQNPIIQL